MLKLALGTAQFGLDYGVSNQSGKVSLSEAREILLACNAFGIRTLDTAINYGNSEQVLGTIGISNFSIITKLPDLSLAAQKDISQLVENHLNRSRSNLECRYLDAVLVHNTRNLLSSAGQLIWNSLKDAQEQRKVGKIGVSIYDPNELEMLEKINIHPEIVQTPYNVFDQKIQDSGWLQKLFNRGVEVHARSVFLQGLLLQDEKQRDKYFCRWPEKFKQFTDLLEKTGSTPLEICLQFALKNPLFTRIVVGVQSAQQLRDIVLISMAPVGALEACHLACDDLDLIRPQNWRLKQRN